MARDFHPIFLQIPFFHGLIPREDLGYLLRKKGDYLIRCSDVEVGKKPESREYIISVNTGEKNKKKFVSANYQPEFNEFRIRHLVIGHADETDGTTKWFLSSFPRFNSIDDLTSHYKLCDFLCKGGFVVRIANPITRAEWELTHGDIEMGKHLGNGEFGEVRVGTLTWEGNKKITVAVKLTKGQSELSKMKRNKMMAEARIMRGLTHPNVVRLYGIGVLQQPLYIVLEMVDGGGLDSYVKKHLPKLSVATLNTIILDTAAGMEFIHSKKIIHRDLAARNCLISTTTIRPCVKISDFGLSRLGEMYTLQTRVKIPIKWCPPETITQFVFTPKSDIWAWGVLIYEIFSGGKEPWEGKNNGEAKQMIMTGVNLPIPNNCPEQLRNYVNKNVWAWEPTKRPTMTEITDFLEQLTKSKRRSAEKEGEIRDSDNSAKNMLSDASSTDNSSHEPTPTRVVKSVESITPCGAIGPRIKQTGDGGAKKKKKKPDDRTQEKTQDKTSDSAEEKPGQQTRRPKLRLGKSRNRTSNSTEESLDSSEDKKAQKKTMFGIHLRN